MRISDWSSDVCSSDLSVLRARLVRAFAGEEVARQPLDDAPLLRAGVLRLVDQQVIEATVELEQHPGDAAVAREQKLGRASCRETGCQYGWITVGAVSLKTKEHNK